MKRAPHDHHPVKVMMAKSADMIWVAIGCRYFTTTVLFIIASMPPNFPTRMFVYVYIGSVEDG